MNESLRLPRWVSIWLVVSTLIVVWDAAFVLLRPASFPDGDLGWLWSFAYTTYMEVDRGYADLSNHAVASLAIMSLFEAILVGAALWTNRIDRGTIAHLLTVIVTSLTGAKTILFFLLDAMHGWASVGHNDFLPLLFIWIIPNGIWIVVPFSVAFITGRRLLRHMSSS